MGRQEALPLQPKARLLTRGSLTRCNKAFPLLCEVGAARYDTRESTYTESVNSSSAKTSRAHGALLARPSTLTDCPSSPPPKCQLRPSLFIHHSWICPTRPCPPLASPGPTGARPSPAHHLPPSAASRFLRAGPAWRGCCLLAHSTPLYRQNLLSAIWPLGGPGPGGVAADTQPEAGG